MNNRLDEMKKDIIAEVEGFFDTLESELENNIEFGVCPCSTHLQYEDLARGSCRVCKREIKITVGA